MNLRVLVVDDDPVVRSILGKSLALLGAVPLTTNRLSEGKRLVEEGAVDVVVIDWNIDNGLTPVELAELAVGLGVQAVFHTASPWVVPEGWWVVAKPSSSTSLWEAIQGCMAGQPPRCV